MLILPDLFPHSKLIQMIQFIRNDIRNQLMLILGVTLFITVSAAITAFKHITDLNKQVEDSVSTQHQYAAQVHNGISEIENMSEESRQEAKVIEDASKILEAILVRILQATQGFKIANHQGVSIKQPKMAIISEHWVAGSSYVADLTAV